MMICIGELPPAHEQTIEPSTNRPKKSRYPYEKKRNINFGTFVTAFRASPKSSP